MFVGAFPLNDCFIYHSLAPDREQPFTVMHVESLVHHHIIEGRDRKHAASKKIIHKIQNPVLNFRSTNLPLYDLVSLGPRLPSLRHSDGSVAIIYELTPGRT